MHNKFKRGGRQRSQHNLRHRGYGRSQKACQDSLPPWLNLNPVPSEHKSENLDVRLSIFSAANKQSLQLHSLPICTFGLHRPCYAIWLSLC